jgi:hypothetical protein
MVGVLVLAALLAPVAPVPVLAGDPTVKEKAP